ncbi:AcrR family transcriptional regulator [Amycolatopsis bartoniae]|uniref:TetR family transcriptional regulator n=1 Tax=Amycolatopsis bartoniae TaxID=941986 RepID=A0A8H9MF57_9PSEU|nr:TetR/AcrR family transcriptional regulator [Amycolatopsis bartoniae]MBB2939371.1 AcrR family transcriptional regulator [Amycolatopsis bartoniae]GHF83513.1 TetR family transcriptional regulator [Amycolatopsis bartoniae]
MTSADSSTRRRRRVTPRKGDLREQAILDAAEAQLETETLEGMTVESIARGAGITRNALYFYFASKQDVLTALVRRTVGELAEDAESTAAGTTSDPRESILRAMRGVEGSWRRHGRVMRAAVELGAVIPDIGVMWNDTVDRYIAVMSDVLRRAGLPDDGPSSAHEVASALCWMTERNFYRASVQSDTEASLSHVSDVCSGIWLAMLP